MSKTPLSAEKQAEKMLRLRTIVIFGIPRDMKLETLSHKLEGIINKANCKQRGKRWVAKKGAERNELKWPCSPPFAVSTNASFGIAVKESQVKPVAQVVVAEKNLSQVKEVCVAA